MQSNNFLNNNFNLQADGTLNFNSDLNFNTESSANYFPTPALSTTDSFLDLQSPLILNHFNTPIFSSLNSPFSASTSDFQSPFPNSTDSFNQINLSNSPIDQQVNYFEPLEPTSPSINPADTVTLTFAQLSALISASANPSTTSSTTNSQKKPSKSLKEFPCPHPGCGKIFTRKFNLKTHSFTHDANRPRDFVCQHHGCGKSFVRIHDLQRHSSIHSRNNGNKCNTCQKHFARSDALSRHIKSGICFEINP
ncbi:hypothetical protein HDU92_003781 [Lobulomyces angularis]|nr:hypothetical protein HDU92_003781 [Lobulomyces angularis]